MDASDERALEILDQFARLPCEEGPVTLSQEYLHDIATVEALPQNRSGADKSWVHKSLDSFRHHFLRARPL